MSILESILLGIVQGIFMFFPVSSTSHLVLTQHWLIQRGSSLPSPESAGMILFDLVVHVGTLISIVVVFRKSLTLLLARIWADAYSIFAGAEMATVNSLEPRISPWINRSLLFPQGKRDNSFLYFRLAMLGMLAVVVTGLIGLPMRSLFKTVFATPIAISITLSITGFLLWWTDSMKRQQRGLRGLNPWVATVIGFSQGLALIPGLSRSGMTISFALLTGLKRRWAAEFSFFIAFPTILGATLLQTLDVMGTNAIASVGILPLFVGFVVSAIVGIFALQMVLNLLYRAKFRYFSYYLWALSIAVVVGVYQGIL